MSKAAVLGVDFSGAARAGRATWIAAAREDGGALVIENLRCAADLPGGTDGRDAAHRALVSWVLERRPSLVA
ncbi:MAG: hypothetical protein ACF8QF_09400, partial [Phycisphaerales bacterium]